MLYALPGDWKLDARSETTPSVIDATIHTINFDMRAISGSWREIAVYPIKLHTCLCRVLRDVLFIRMLHSLTIVAQYVLSKNGLTFCGSERFLVSDVSSLGASS